MNEEIMTEIEAITWANTLDEDCIQLSPGHKIPTARLLKEFNLDREGYGIFFENYGHSKGEVKRCIIFWVKKKNMKSKEKGKDLIIFKPLEE